MVCPKCKKDSLIKICMKRNKRNALMCEICETLWFQDELINNNTGHNVNLYTGNFDNELTFDEVADEDNKSVMQSDIR